MELLAIVSCCERERHFSESVALGKLAMIESKTTHPRILGKHKLVSKSLKKKKKGCKVGWVGREKGVNL